MASNVPTLVQWVLEFLLALSTPTISRLAEEKWLDISTVVAEKQVPIGEIIEWGTSPFPGEGGTDRPDFVQSLLCGG